MKRGGFNITLTCVLLACCAAEAQIDQLWKKVDTTPQSNNLSRMALSNDKIAGGPSDPLQFIPVAPCRVADTRTQGGPIQGGTHQDFTIAGPTCGIPGSAAAYSLNVSVIPRGSLRYLTVWPAGQPQPVTTTMNSLDGRIKNNAAIVAAGTAEAMSVYATDTTDVVLDINGYFAPVSGSTLAFYPLTPCRVVDTRNPPGPLGGPYLQGNQERDFPLLESSCTIPSNAIAYSLNVTALPRMGVLGFLTVWAAGQPQPPIATLNDLTGTIVSNAAIVPAGTGGAIAAYVTNDTDLVVDINGVFAAPGPAGLSLYTITPCRALDTRKSVFGFSGQLRIPILGVPGNPCGLPGTAQAFVFNATVFPQTPLNYLTLWADGEPRPSTWTLNAVDGAITSNMVIVAAGSEGKVDAFASGTTHLVLDISSYFAP